MSRSRCVKGRTGPFHEAVGDLIGIAARQPAYLRQIGLLPQDREIDQIQWLLDEALNEAAVFIPFSAGTMSFFEHDLYEEQSFAGRVQPTLVGIRWPVPGSRAAGAARRGILRRLHQDPHQR